MSEDGSNGYEGIASMYVAGRGTRPLVGDAIGANGFWVFVADFDTSLDAHIHKEGILFEIFAAGLYHARGQLRHGERLHEVVGSPEFEAGADTVFVAQRGE